MAVAGVTARMVASIAAGADSFGDQWRDLALPMWIAAGVAAVAWFVVFGVLAAATNPRRVAPGPETLDLGGPEPPAVVNLITRDWRLGREALPATLLDLAARRHLAIDQVGDQTLVRLRRHGASRRDTPRGNSGSNADGNLARYEDLVLGHVRHLADHADDGVVPAEALTTGPEQSSKGWWRQFQRAVRDDARARGLSRPRWSRWMRLTLVIAGLAVGVAVGLAMSASFPDSDGDRSAASSNSNSSSSEGSDGDDDPVTAAIAGGVAAFGVLMVIVRATSHERDTPAGRQAAARWLGLRELLSSDVIFAEHPPAGIAIWDRHLAYGAGLGVAHGAVRALPLGAESDTEAWSPVGGRWRRVRVRYPELVPPGFGRHPLKVAAAGLVELAVFGYLLRWLGELPSAIHDAVRDLGPDDLDLALVDQVAEILAVALAVLIGVVVLRAAVMFLLGVVDLVRGRRVVEGRVVRFRLRGTKNQQISRVAVDDGTSDRILAWRLPANVDARQGATVRARVTPALSHVRDFERVGTTATAATTGVEPDDLEEELADDGSGTGSAAPAKLSMAELSAIAAGTSTAHAGPPPPLPDASALNEMVQLPLQLDPDTKPHPLALQGGSASFTGPGGARIQIAWANPIAIVGFARIPKFFYRTIDGLGDEAYRTRFGGHVTARRGDHVALVMTKLPGRPDDERDRVTQAVAQLMLEGASRPTTEPMT